MDQKRLYDLLEDEHQPQKNDIPELKKIIANYPYFQAALFLYLKALYLHDYPTFERELEQLSIFIADRRTLFYYILREEYSLFFKKTGKEHLPEDKTNALINAFFESRGMNDSGTELEYDIMHTAIVSTDYLTYLDNTATIEDSAPPVSDAKFKHQNIIDSFIDNPENSIGLTLNINRNSDSVKAAIAPPMEEESEELGDDIFFTETLAKIYIRQKKYEKAHKIIKHLSLNYPEKNIYFADQLNFLDKLIINSKFKDKQ